MITISRNKIISARAAYVKYISEKNITHNELPVNNTNVMSLRDYFAAQVMPHFAIDAASKYFLSDNILKQVAIKSYRLADEMIKERNK